jgi:transcriptional regulator with XRE-family HTH domain
VPTPITPLAEVVGENCKRLRGRIGITQDDLARHARTVGLRWRASSVGDFEAGRSSPTLATVVAVAAALQSALDDPVRLGPDPTDIRLSDLVACAGWVSVTEALIVPGPTLAQWLGGAVATLPPLDAYRPPPTQPGDGSAYAELEKELRKAHATLDGAEGVLARSGLAEQRTAKTLGVDPGALALASFELWGGTFTEERDRRAGPDANKQKRGQIARTMRAELAVALEQMWPRTD